MAQPGRATSGEIAGGRAGVEETWETPAATCAAEAPVAQEGSLETLAAACAGEAPEAQPGALETSARAWAAQTPGEALPRKHQRQHEQVHLATSAKPTGEKHEHCGTQQRCSTRTLPRLPATLARVETQKHRFRGAQPCASPTAPRDA